MRGARLGFHSALGLGVGLRGQSVLEEMEKHHGPVDPAAGVGTGTAGGRGHICLRGSDCASDVGGAS